MTVLENDFIYAYFRDELPEVVDVYIDSSFRLHTAVTHSKYTSTAYGTGWVMAGKHKKRILGFGAESRWDEVVGDSIFPELYGIRSFFDVLYKNHPNLSMQKTKFRIHCDNRSAILALNSGFKDKDIVKAKRAYSKLGKLYEEMLFYMTHLNVEFLWVKGHADNTLNNIADIIARKCFREATADNDFIGERRRSFVQTEFHKRSLALPISLGGKQDKSQVDNITIAKGTVISMYGVSETGFALFHKETGDLYHDVVHHINITSRCLDLKLMRFALTKYLEDPENYSDIASLSVNTHLSTQAVNAVNGIGTRKESNHLLNFNDDELAVIEDIRELKTRVSVRFNRKRSSKTDILGGIASVVANDYGLIKFDEQYDGDRLAKRMRRLANS